MTDGCWVRFSGCLERGKTRHTATGGLTESSFLVFSRCVGGNRDIVREAGVSITLGLFQLGYDFDLQEYP